APLSLPRAAQRLDTHCRPRWEGAQPAEAYAIRKSVIALENSGGWPFGCWRLRQRNPRPGHNEMPQPALHVAKELRPGVNAMQRHGSEVVNEQVMAVIEDTDALQHLAIGQPNGDL